MSSCEWSPDLRADLGLPSSPPRLRRPCLPTLVIAISTAQHLLPPRPSDQKAVARQADVPYERVSSYKALRDLTAGRTPSDELNSTPKHKPLAFIDSLLNPPPSVTADGPGALTEELALQMVTHPTHTDAQRGSSPHNLRLSFMGRRVLEMHLQMFLLHAAQQEGKKVGEKGDVSRTALLDTQRKVSVEEEDADLNPEAAVTEAETDSQEALAADASAVDPIAEAQEGEEAKPSWEHPSVPSFADASPSVLAGHAYGRPNMWRVVRPDGEEIGDGTPGSLAEELVKESALGYLVGRSWNVDSGMRYGTKIVSQATRTTQELEGVVVDRVGMFPFS